MMMISTGANRVIELSISKLTIVNTQGDRVCSSVVLRKLVELKRERDRRI